MKTLLLKQVKVLDSTSEWHHQTVDIRIENGIITGIAPQLQAPDGAEVWQTDDLHVSQGWLDVGTQIGDPGFEHKEDLDSASRAAAFGGFTALACQPNTSPVLHSKSEILYIKNRTKGNLVDVFPIGAISENCQGKDLAELFDMFYNGAVAFSDGRKSIQNNGLMLRALLYTKPFKGLIINHPHDKDLAAGGMMHEGVMSTSLGMKGIPALAEEMMIQRDLQLVEYADARLLLANISTAGSVELIRQAKAKGLKVSASVNPMNLIFNDAILSDFDTNYKVLPPIRSENDRQALLAGLKDGTIDLICTHHLPQDTENKMLEFVYAAYGVTMLETAFAALRTHLSHDLPLDLLIKKWTTAPRHLLNLPSFPIKVGQLANLTIFQPDQTWVYQQATTLSKSHNSPFIGQTLRGKVVGIINNHQRSKNFEN